MGEKPYLTKVKFQKANAGRVMNTIPAYSKCSMSIGSHYSKDGGNWEGEEEVTCGMLANSKQLDLPRGRCTARETGLDKREPGKFLVLNNDEIKDVL